jgi:RNA-directed DNA polymerase
VDGVTWQAYGDGLEERLAGLHGRIHRGAYRAQEFLGFSYGFRPGRKQHDALDALYVGITGKKVNYVLDLDIRWDMIT